LVLAKLKIQIHQNIDILGVERLYVKDRPNGTSNRVSSITPARCI
jgi:hypothetical protein